MELLSIITLVISAIAALVSLKQMSVGKQAIKEMEDQGSKTEENFKNEREVEESVSLRQLSSTLNF